LGDRVFGAAVEPGGPGAGVQLWWQVPRLSSPVVGASAVLEVLEPPVAGLSYRWGLQAGVVDAAGRRIGEVVDEVDSSAVVSDAPRTLSVAPPLPGTGLVDVAVWMDLAQPPDDPPVVARWSALRCDLASGASELVRAVQVTFPSGFEWRRLDVVVDEVGVLQVSNTPRTAANLSVLELPPDR
jgi:hypothetical protein